ncbi:CGNR zinc finger domain-containing protein [Pseudonocardia sulfidoxydans]
MVQERTLVDTVSQPAELAAWVAESSLGADYGVPTSVSRAVHSRAVELRVTLKAGFAALASGEPMSDDALAHLNAVLADDPGTELVRDDAGALRRRPRIDLGRDASALPWILADAAARVLVDGRAQQLRRCANHDTCVLMFLDSSRSRNRRWCSMELCGNRNKVAAHSARARQSVGDPRTS